MSSESATAAFDKIATYEDRLTPTYPMRIFATSRNGATGLFFSQSRGPLIKHAVSIGAPGDRMPSGININRQSVLRLEFDDYCWYAAPGEDTLNYPKPEHVEQLIQWGRQTLDKDGLILCHCFAGISRSTAAVFILTAMQLGLDNTDLAKERLFALRPYAHPNYLMIKYADEILETGGLLKRTLDTSFRSNPFIADQYGAKYPLT